MSNKKQPYINIVPPIELGPAPPRYQPPPQVLKTAVTNKTKNYPSSQQPIPVEPPTGQDVKFYPSQVKTGKQNFLPPQYTNPPGAVIQPPAIQRQSSAAIGLPRRAPEEDPRLNNADMLKFVRKAQDSETVLAESARRIQPVSSETRALKEANQRLSDDNQELRDLCCFLDDDRQKGRKLAREWQRFGRYTASVMRQEVSAYQSKLRELDNKQQDLIKDNLELKELCLYLDEERSQNVSACPCGFRPGPRDDGDGGSSSSTNADEPALPVHVGPNCVMEENLRRQRTVFNDEMMEYVRGLELRVKQLEEDNRLLQLQLDQTHPSTMAGCDLGSHASTVAVGGRPEAVVQALQVLEVREQLERGPDADRKCPAARLLPGPPSGPPAGPVVAAAARLPPADLDDGEKALVREMCNVVWRKLEEGPTPRR